MKTFEMRKYILAAALGIAPMAAMADTAQISDLTLGIQPGAAEDSVAAYYQPKIEADLRDALVLRLKENMGVDDGIKMRVVVTDLALNDKPISMNAPEFNELEGTVAFFLNDEDAPFYNTILMYNAYAPEGTTTLTMPSTEAFYTALVNRMADDIAAILPSEDFVSAAMIIDEDPSEEPNDS